MDIEREVRRYLSKGGDPSRITDSLIMESSEVDLASRYGINRTIMEYLIALETMFDRASLYFFDGWKNGVIRETNTNEFWLHAIIELPPYTDESSFRFLKSIITPGSVSVQKNDRSYYLKIKVPRRKLDMVIKEIDRAVTKMVDKESLTPDETMIVTDSDDG